MEKRNGKNININRESTLHTHSTKKKSFDYTSNTGKSCGQMDFNKIK